MSELFFKRLTVGVLGTCCYVLGLKDRDDCIVIDPGDEAAAIRTACEGRRIAAILLTHGHFDHIGAVDALREDGTAVMIHQADEAYLNDTQLNCSWLMGRTVAIRPADRLLADGDTVEAAGLTLKVLHTPGHTPGGVCYQLEDLLFTGDTMFEVGYGRTDLPGGDEDTLFASLRKVYPLSKTHTIYPGHGS
ncbi:MAG: MBL fold metallo-hydrolase [Clostridia bacterium]|nr:MBL fold metallo-hydrolase [Clostridia bacterium]